MAKCSLAVLLHFLNGGSFAVRALQGLGTCVFKVLDSWGFERVHSFQH